MKSEEELLLEQKAYYRARSAEYDDWFYRRDRFYKGEDHKARWEGEVQILRSALDHQSPSGTILELACGTGIWTQELARYAESLDVVDSSPEVLEICKSKIQHPRITFHCSDIFDWAPQRKYDFVFFSFWLSHVPPSRFAPFWKKVRAALDPGGAVFFLDNAQNLGAPTDQQPRSEDDWLARRDLRDGREFDIVKIFYEPSELEEQLRSLGWTCRVRRTDSFFIYGEAS